nr:uncharacterized protein LOC123276179 [Equus asinus]
MALDSNPNSAIDQGEHSPSAWLRSKAWDTSGPTAPSAGCHCLLHDLPNHGGVLARAEEVGISVNLPLLHFIFITPLGSKQYHPDFKCLETEAERDYVLISYQLSGQKRIKIRCSSQPCCTFTKDFQQQHEVGRPPPPCEPHHPQLGGTGASGCSETATTFRLLCGPLPMRPGLWAWTAVYQGGMSSNLRSSPGTSWNKTRKLSKAASRNFWALC